MAILDIIMNPNPLLRQVASPVKEFGESLDHMMDDMIQTMRMYSGVGLAGPQVGILKRIFVLEYKGTVMKIVNPELSDASGRAVLEEGCLSIPNVLVDIERSTKLTLTYETPYGEKHKIRVNNFIARIIQHETDHLNGVLILDFQYKNNVKQS